MDHLDVDADHDVGYPPAGHHGPPDQEALRQPGAGARLDPLGVGVVLHGLLNTHSYRPKRKTSDRTARH